MNTTYIYALIDPISNEIRYVGKSISPNKRYYQHINPRGFTHKDNWIRKLLSNSLKPVMKILEECNDYNWEERERFWISSFDNLTNSTEGGQDGRMSEKVKKKLRIMNSGENNPNYGKKASEKTRELISDKLKNRNLSEEHKKRIGGSLSKKISIEGVSYESLSEASRKLGLTTGIIFHRLNSKNYPDYKYIL